MLGLEFSADTVTNDLMATVEGNQWEEQYEEIVQVAEPVRNHDAMTGLASPLANGSHAINSYGNISGPISGLALPGMPNFGAPAHPFGGHTYNSFLEAPLYENSLLNHGNDTSFSTVNTSFNSLGASGGSTFVSSFDQEHNTSFNSTINSSFTDYQAPEYMEPENALTFLPQQPAAVK